MAKTFKDKMQQKAVNPTLQFISQPDQEEEQSHRLKIETRPLYQREEDTTEPQTAEDGKRKRKTATASSTAKKAPPARRAQPQYDEETKSRRLQLLLTPSLYEAVKDKAAEARLSVNEYINSILKDAISRK